MQRIKLLSKSVSNRIAAGEVVERPLSVVKELVENAIDAGASAVSIDITDGGIKEIRVTDNGWGIPAADVSLAFEKHATSKISTDKDLGFIITQGFRGEALSSIAAVSVSDMKTKTREEEMGSHIRVTGGRADASEPAGLPDGTSVSVSNLFFNVPARLKFLKKPAQEAAYITDLVSRYIMAFPEISFHYRSGGKTIYHSPGNGDLKSAVYCVYGSTIMDNIVYVSHTTGEIAVDGYVSRPDTVMKNRRAGSVFINRRYVRSTVLHDMVKNAYGQTLVKGEFPFFALNISLPVSAVDVNVHPNKLQVRFKDAAAVEHVIKEAVSAACANVRGSVALDTPEKAAPSQPSVQMHTTPEFTQADLFTGFPKSMLREKEQTAVQDTPYSPPSEDLPEPEAVQAQTTEDKQEEQDATGSVMTTPHEYKLIGSFAKTYALVEQGDNLLLIDQHAAHERLLYDRFSVRQADASQPLLTPLILTLSHEQKNLVDENIDAFTSLGFDIAPFGVLEYKISAVPSMFYGAGITDLFYDALDEIGQRSNDAVLMRERIIRAACRSAVKAGDLLSERELNHLVDGFLMTETIPTCPHGRPIITVITKKQIEKSFKRIV